MTKYTEPEMFHVFNRLIRIYLESYPDDKEALHRFMRWSHSQYGYDYKSVLKNEQT
jgi:hypothetical protein